jgi:tRNA-dihydrouridine synthase
MATGTHLAPPTISERVRVAKRHLELSLEWKGERRGIVEMRRHYTNYFKGVAHFKEIRKVLVQSEDPNEIFDTLGMISMKSLTGEIQMMKTL